MDKHPSKGKRINRELERLLGLAYERDLAKALSVLEPEFARWRRGEIDAFELEKAIHEFHNGAARDLFKRYAGISKDWRGTMVSNAIARESIGKEDIDPSLLDEFGKVLDDANWLKNEVWKESGDGEPATDDEE